jgi:hypothetical protein
MSKSSKPSVEINLSLLTNISVDFKFHKNDKTIQICVPGLRSCIYK